MPKRKTSKTSAGHLPAGFINTSAGFPKAWAPEIGDTLQGTVTSIRRVSAQTLKYDNAKKGQMVTIVSVADADGEITGVFESKGIEEFCAKVKQGDEVFLRLNDVRKIGKKRFKDITAAIKAKKGK